MNSFDLDLILPIFERTYEIENQFSQRVFFRNPWMKMKWFSGFGNFKLFEQGNSFLEISYTFWEFLKIKYDEGVVDKRNISKEKITEE